MMLNTLPLDHPLRLAPLEGAELRYSILLPLELVDSQEVWEEKLEKRARGERIFTSWKKVMGWKISKLCYNQLGPVWTDDAEWRVG